MGFDVESSSMTVTELRECRARLQGYLARVFRDLGRAERRYWARRYVQGLLLEGGRKTAAGIARRLQESADAEQALQQLLSQSPWSHEAVRRAVAQQVIPELGRERVGWIVDDTGFPKKGAHSVGVARQYSGTLGKVANCQIGVSLSYATADAAIPLDFALYLPEEWVHDPARCERAGIPPAARTHRTKWELALDLIDRARAWAVPEGVVVADAGYGQVQAFRQGLRERNLAYVVGITSTVAVWTTPPDPPPLPRGGRGRPRKRHWDLPAPQSVQAVAEGLPADTWQRVTWREGTKGPLTSRFAAVRVQPAHGHTQGEIREPVQWLLIEWPEGEPAPTKYWLSTLPEQTSLQDLVWWAKLRWWIEHNDQQLKDELGLDHFEGRSWRGWHPQVTLTCVAFAFLVLEMLRNKKNYWVDPPEDATSGPSLVDQDLGPLPDVLASLR